MPSGKPGQLTVIRFGQEESLDVPEGDVLTFPEGLVGMPHLRRFVVVDDERVAPCRWLQSLEEPSLAFLVVEPALVDPVYKVELPDEEAAALEVGEEPADVWVLITIRPEPERSTANLLAPVIVNPRTRTGRQVILHDSGYSLRHPLNPAAGEGTDGEAAPADTVKTEHAGSSA